MAKKPKELYMIKHVESGKFSKGGYHPSFTHSGKVWKSIGWLERHLKDLDHNYKRAKERGRPARPVSKIYEGCVIVKYTEEEMEDLTNTLFLMEI